MASDEAYDEVGRRLSRLDFLEEKISALIQSDRIAMERVRKEMLRGYPVGTFLYLISNRESLDRGTKGIVMAPIFFDDFVMMRIKVTIGTTVLIVEEALHELEELWSLKPPLTIGDRLADPIV